MSRTVSSTVRSEIQASETYLVPLVVLTIDHPNMAEPVRVVNNNEDIVFETNTYKAASFKFTPPSQEGSELSGATITIANIDRSLMSILRAVTDPPTIEAVIVLVGDTGVEREAGPWTFDLAGIQYDKDKITGQLTYNFRPKQSLSTIKVTLRDFPSLIVYQ